MQELRGQSTICLVAGIPVEEIHDVWGIMVGGYSSFRVGVYGDGVNIGPTLHAGPYMWATVVARKGKKTHKIINRLFFIPFFSFFFF